MFVFTVNAFGSSVTRITFMDRDKVLSIIKNICPTYTDFKYELADDDLIKKLSVPVKYSQIPFRETLRGLRPMLIVKERFNSRKRKPAIKKPLQRAKLRVLPVERNDKWIGSADYQRTHNLWFFEEELERLNLKF